MELKCKRCGNTKQHYFALNAKGENYCRLCLPFNGLKASPYKRLGAVPKLCLKYPLTLEQEKVSQEILKNVKENKPVLVHAVTGAGKTELVYKTMEYVLQKGGQVGFATPRHDVVLELAPRIREAFPSANVIPVCEGHTEVLEGDIVVLTAHQLYRYETYFDLLVFDEIDAFPYKCNALLKNFFKKSIKGTYVLLTATPSKTNLIEIEKEGGKIVSLNKRYHGKPLPIPQFKKYGWIPFLTVLKDMKRFLAEGKPLFVFAPTIEKTISFYHLVSLFLPNGGFVNSKDEQREKKIEDFKKGLLRYLVCTAVLERGVTIKDLQVLVMDSDYQDIYDSASLIQIAGRAGRKSGYENGEVLFYGKEKTEAIEESIEVIKKTNEG